MVIELDLEGGAKLGQAMPPEFRPRAPRQGVAVDPLRSRGRQPVALARLHERVLVKICVARDQLPAERVGDALEHGGPFRRLKHVLRRDPVDPDVVRLELAFGIDQSGPLPLDAVAIEADEADLADRSAVPIGRLDIDGDEIVHPAPRNPRVAP